MEEKILVEAINLKKYFKVGASQLHAVDGINFRIRQGTTLGVVGESGCGKSTLGRVLLRLYDVTDGKILYDGADIHPHWTQRAEKGPRPHADDLSGPIWLAGPAQERQRIDR